MAPPQQRRPQKRNFYSGRWTKYHDTAFINALCWKADKGFTQHDPLRPNKMALEFTSNVVTRMWNWKFNEETYAWHLERLRTRYLTFKAILENPAFVWDEERNVVHGTDDAWKALIMEHRCTNAYLKRGEPQWQNLQFIFEQDEDGVWGTLEDFVNVSSGESEVYCSAADGVEFLGRRCPGDAEDPIDLVSTDSDSGWIW
ncbi:hypothetical protein Salat_1714300 [Sesamum alatum]|uniref:Myb/SANT-like domain-containing protein n=1 Tax=Sesamum alatum TaxID=300844 RepID=A0AAE1Y889_9LAMI|nr:hypothetical protein Salat_1714300 [Sesamum alatum]